MATRQERLLDLLEQWCEARERGRAVTAEELCKDCPELAGELASLIADHLRLEQLAPRSGGEPRPHPSSWGPGDPEATTTPAAGERPPDVVACPQVPGYEILDVLGRGGMGVVYKARQLRLNRVVALKMILHSGHAGPDEHSRFLREAEAIAAIKHPGVVQVYDFGTHDGAPYFALEFCEGGSLAKKLSGKPIPPREAADLVEQVARAVQAAHALGIVHRDLKPGNVLLTAPKAGGPDAQAASSASSPRSGASRPSVSGAAVSRDVAKVTDFGLARRLDAGPGLTQPKDVMGTPSYMAPEQARATRDAGPPADVYALGAILYECLTGRPPFLAATTFETLQQVQRDEPPAPRELNAAVPRDLETVALKCLQKDPGLRYDSADALADDLRRWQNGETILARPAGVTERAVKWARRRPGAAAGLCGALMGVAAILTLAVVASYQWKVAGEQRTKAEQALRNLEGEQRERALSQIGALREAATGAVPAILATLEENRGEVLPRLRELHGEEDVPAKKARLALALLPIEPEAVRDAVLQRMLKEDDPAEVVLLRDNLKPHAAGMAPRLWRLAGDEDAEKAERFRALVGLAAFDPDDPRWLEAAPKLVEELLGSNSLRLGAWVLALEPVSRALSVPLGVAFRDPAPERADRRESAAQVLALYLSRRPDPPALYELLLDSDAKQYALLRPLLDADREKAAARMSAELARRPDYWKDPPLDAAWKTPGAAVVAEVEEAGGIVAERFALCQALPLARLGEVTAALGAAGYRPVSVRPWSSLPTAGEGDRAALVWVRDGRDWKLEAGLSQERLTERDAHWQKVGLIPDDVAAYRTKGGVRYVGLWRRAAEGEQAVLYAGVPAEKHDFATNVFKADGYTPARVQALVEGGKTGYCGVWWKGKDKVEDWQFREAADEGLHAGLILDGALLPLDVSVRPAAPPRPLRQWWLADLKKAEGDALKQPKEADPHFFRGVALYNLGRDAEALEAFDEYYEKSKLFFGHRYRALLKARAGKSEQAARDLASFTRVSTDKPFNAALTAMVGVYLGEADEALKPLDDAVKADGKDARLACLAAGVYARASERARMRQAAWAASLLGSPSPWTLALRPKPDQESRYADRAVELLRLAVARGYADFDAMQTDAYLEAIRSHVGYRELLHQNGQLRRYASVWRGDATKQAEALQGLSAEAHLKRCRDLMANGYRPVALSLASLEGEKVPFAASVWHRPVVLADGEALARRQATAAATLLTLKQTEEVWPLFRHSADPTRRSYLVWRAGERGADPRLLIQRLLKEKDVSARRALIVALGEYDDRQLPEKDRQPLVETLLSWYRDDPDPGVHSAISWLLRHKAEGPTPRLLDWGQAGTLAKIDKQLAGQKPRTKPALLPPLPPAGGGGRGGEGWYVNGQGQTMVMIKGPVEFRMGSPLWEPDRVAVNERPHVRRIPRSYAIGSTAVTVEQYRRFLKDNPDVEGDFLERYSPEDGGPIVSVSWYAAARYCNWLSVKEGIPEEQWCYPKKIASGMRMPAGYLGRTGYRLPTEAELEYACKAGSEQSRHYGSAEALLPRYANYQSNSKDRTWPVGQKRPNDLGLFDAHGNVWNWCQDKALFYPQRTSSLPVGDAADATLIDESSGRALRGGSFHFGGPGVRSSSRGLDRPVSRNFGLYGLRVCRTLPPDSFPTLPP